MSLKKIIISALFATFALSNTALSASFDCKKAKSEIEVKICSDEYLSTLDAALSRVYKAALEQDKSFLPSQKKWLKTRDKNNEANLTLQYESRVIEVLSNSNYKPKYGKDSAENLIISFLISKHLSISPEDNLARLQTKSLKVSKASGVIAFPIISGNRESEYQFVLFKDGSYSKMLVPTFDSTKKEVINNEKISGLITMKDNEIEVFSGSGNHGGTIYTFKVEGDHLALVKQESISASTEGKEVITTEYKK